MPLTPVLPQTHSRPRASVVAQPFCCRCVFQAACIVRLGSASVVLRSAPTTPTPLTSPAPTTGSPQQVRTPRLPRTLNTFLSRSRSRPTGAPGGEVPGALRVVWPCVDTARRQVRTWVDDVPLSGYVTPHLFRRPFLLPPAARPAYRGPPSIGPQSLHSLTLVRVDTACVLTSWPPALSILQAAGSRLQAANSVQRLWLSDSCTMLSLAQPGA